MCQLEGNTPIKEFFIAKSLSETCIKVLAWRSVFSKNASWKWFILRFKNTLLKNDSFDFVNRCLNQSFYSSEGGCDLETVQLVSRSRICEVQKDTLAFDSDLSRFLKSEVSTTRDLISSINITIESFHVVHYNWDVKLFNLFLALGSWYSGKSNIAKFFY